VTLAAWAQPQLTLQPFVSGLALPVEIAHAGDGSGRLFVLEQAGRIRVIRDGQLLAAPFLDIRSIVRSGGEQGLLGLAFHPSYATNGLFYVYHNRPLAGSSTGSEIVLARYSRYAPNPDLADPSTRTILLTIAHPTYDNHNGGKIAFGPDGYLYIGVGDGGGGGNILGTAQSLGDLRGKILRIDVDSASPYAIPPSNPFAGSSDPSIRKEIWAYGLRNPWRFTFDRALGDLFIADVGQNAWEEVDFEPRASPGGRNYGWSAFEGTHCFSPSTNCSLPGAIAPILEYAHDSNGGFSITGGYRYRGGALPALHGYFVYGDYVSGRIWAAQQVATPGGGGAWSSTQVASLSNVSTFGEDENGELYAANHSAGTVVRLTPPAQTIPRLANISTRARVMSGDDVMIAGFIVGGSTAKRLVINVAGPSLAGFGIASPLANPTLTLVRSSDNAVLATNDDWQSQANPSDVAAIQASGFQPNHPLEPAIIASLGPGAYTAIVQGVGGGAGVGLVGVFEADHPETPLVNISTRARVQTGEDVMIAGFVVGGSSPKTVVVNVAGPWLATFGVVNPLQNPTLTLVRSSDNAILAANDDWQNQDAASVNAIQASGFQPNHPLEPAIIATLAPGAYTVIVQGAGETTGIGLVGVFVTP
jgi:glucose/arabinose dehydrogenase